MRNNFFWLAACSGCLLAVMLFLVVSRTAPFQDAITWISKRAQSAAVFFVQSITVAQIQSDYLGIKSADSALASAGKVRILIVPGHQPYAGGTEFGGVYERNIVVDIADALAGLLTQNPHYDVMVARTKTAWNPVLQSYFDTHFQEIEEFRRSQELQMEGYLASRSILPPVDRVYHIAAQTNAALQLYGINKWSSENKYSIVLHLHINDYAGRSAHKAGTYDGFVIYAPDHQYSNAIASKAVGEAIAVRLNAYHATSTLPQEAAGVVEDQELIAIGSNNSVDGAALVVEYGYIYEPQFQQSSVQSAAIADYAYKTYLGLQDFFNDPIPTYGSMSFPYDWNEVTALRGESGPGIYALQSALHRLGYYPSSDDNFSDCPISGKVGLCTDNAIAAYQFARGLPATGQLGPQTRAALESDIAAL
ncbi:MAG: peptidoglycan-binding domain-containing protein [Patescibacteria group bacterium]